MKRVKEYGNAISGINLTPIIDITLVLLIIMLVAFRAYERSTLRFVSWVTARNVNLALFMFTIFIVPLILVFI